MRLEEKASVMLALRFWQAAGRPDQDGALSNAGIRPLFDEEIDDLCTRLCAGINRALALKPSGKEG